MKNMTYQEFIKLPFNRQCTLLRDLAVQVAFRKDSRMRYFLFQIHSFYIEVEVHLREDRILDLVSFSDTVELDKYIADIDISEALLSK